MNENERLRAEWEENQQREIEERHERVKQAMLKDPERFKSGKAVVFESTNLADPIIATTVKPDINYEANLYAAQIEQILNSQPEQVIVKRFNFSAVQEQPADPKPEPEPKPEPVQEQPAEIVINNSIKHDQVIDTILEKIGKVSFRKMISGKNADQWQNTPKEEKDKIKVSHAKYQICVVDHIQVMANQNQFSLCQNNYAIHIFNGNYWKKYSADRFSNFLGEAAKKMGVNKFTADHYLFRDQLLKQFYASAYLPEPEIDPNKVLLNLKNGTFEITGTGAKRRNFNEADFLTYQLNFNYDSTATAPKFMEYLNRVLPDPDRQQIIAEYLGYIFIRNGSNILKEEKCLILYGSGANGKSVLFEIIRALLGSQNISSYSMESLTDTNGYYRATIDNKLLNYASEISTKMDPNRFKQLVSGEPIEARHPRGYAMQIEQYAKLMFNCNELPKDTEQTHAFFRRFLIVPFDVVIPEGEQNKNLHSTIIESELSGVFNWILSGLKRLLNNGKFSECKASEQALNKYRHESDNVSLFVEEWDYIKVTNKKEFLPLGQLYENYQIFCKDSGYRSLTKNNFSKRLQNLKFKKERGTAGKWLFNIAVKK